MMDKSIIGNILVPDSWIKKTFHKNPVNELGELIYAASLARDDSNGRLRGFIPTPFIPGMTTNEPVAVFSFSQAVERALVHTALFLREVYEKDWMLYGIRPHLTGISKKARDKYDRFEGSLARHHLLYDDQDGGRIRRDNPPPDNRGPEGDFSKVPFRPPSLRGSGF